MIIRDEKAVRLKKNPTTKKKANHKKTIQTHQPNHTKHTHNNQKNQTTTKVAGPLTICNLSGELLAIGQIR